MSLAMTNNGHLEMGPLHNVVTAKHILVKYGRVYCDKKEPHLSQRNHALQLLRMLCFAADCHKRIKLYAIKLACL